MTRWLAGVLSAALASAASGQAPDLSLLDHGEGIRNSDVRFQQDRRRLNRPDRRKPDTRESDRREKALAVTHGTPHGFALLVADTHDFGAAGRAFHLSPTAQMVVLHLDARGSIDIPLPAASHFPKIEVVVRAYTWNATCPMPPHCWSPSNSLRLWTTTADDPHHKLRTWRASRPGD